MSNLETGARESLESRLPSEHAPLNPGTSPGPEWRVLAIVRSLEQGKLDANNRRKANRMITSDNPTDRAEGLVVYGVDCLRRGVYGGEYFLAAGALHDGPEEFRPEVRDVTFEALKAAKQCATGPELRMLGHLVQSVGYNMRFTGDGTSSAKSIDV